MDAWLCVWMSLTSTPCTEKLKIKNQEENHLTDNIFFFSFLQPFFHILSAADVFPGRVVFQHARAGGGL